MGEENFFLDLFMSEHGGGGGGGANCGRRKKGVDDLLFGVKSFTDVQRWMNVDDDIFLFLSFVRSKERTAKRFHRTNLIHVYQLNETRERKTKSIRSLFEGEIKRR